jgi:hypothetical protein
MSECRSAIKKKDSLPGCCESFIAGIIAPKRFPRCGLPLLCIPVKILAIQCKENEVLGIEAMESRESYL